MELNQLCKDVNQWAEEKGWNKDLILGNQVANFHTEISEAWEEIRNNRRIDEIYVKDGKPEGFPIEIADLIIRVAHTCGYYDIDIEEAIRMKMEYNQKRPYRHGGKSA